MDITYPKPLISLTPLLGANNSPTENYPKIPSVLDSKYVRMTTSGRYAIALALEHIGVTAEDIVLIPAYHCEAMVAPVKIMGLIPIFYSINLDTSINIEDIKRKISPRIKAIIVTHYFGFPQELTEIRALCNHHNIKLIEDCAHAFFGTYEDLKPLGRIGDYAIASSMKFLPLYEGGVLCSELQDLAKIQLSAPKLPAQIKSMINIVEKSVEYKKLGSAGLALNNLFAVKNSIWSVFKQLKNTSTKADTTDEPIASHYYGLDKNRLHLTISLASTLIIKLSNLNTIAHRQRKNYQRLDAALSKLPNSRPLFGQLPPNIVPWAYPLYVHNPQQYFSKLKMQGIPIWRFGEFLDAEVTEKICPVSVEYSKHIFQFPCHPSLSNTEIDWMIQQISQTLSDA